MTETPSHPMILAHLGALTHQVVPTLTHALPDARVVEADNAGANEADVVVTLSSEGAGLQSSLGPRVRWVHVLGAGIEGIPLAALGDRTLTCSKGAASAAIAEFVLATMLAFEKQLPASWVTEVPPSWNRATLGGLRGKTAGIIGLGAIGSEIARRCLAFEMRVTAVRRRTAEPTVEAVQLAGSLVDLLAESDHVIVAAPATPDTVHLLNRQTFEGFKPGAHLVNVSRGSLVDQEALLDALDTGRLAMASLDVADPEPLPAGHRLYSHPKVRLSPHISWSSPDTMRRTFGLFVENVRRYQSGEPLLGVVDTSWGY